MKRLAVKIAAVLLAAIQLAFGCWLMNRGKLADRTREKEIEAILTNGTEYILQLQYFQVPDGDNGEFVFGLAQEGSRDGRYVPFVPRGKGSVRYLGESLRERPADDAYFDSEEGARYYRLDTAALREVFSGEASYYARALFSQDRFDINGTYRSVCAVVKALNGSIVFTGMSIDGVRYGEAGRE